MFRVSDALYVRRELIAGFFVTKCKDDKYRLAIVYGERYQEFMGDHPFNTREEAVCALDELVLRFMK